jgi:hypothetical protein
MLPNRKKIGNFPIGRLRPVGDSRSAFDKKFVRLFPVSMRIRVKVLLVTLFLAVGSVARSELVFEQSELELHPAVGDATAVGHFKYQNKGDKAVAIKNVSTSCGCTAATAKNSAEPGEKGEVTATFKVGDRTGTQQKTITVTTDDPMHPTAMLNLKVVIPQLLDLQPTFVYWQAGEEAKAKTIVVKVGKDVSIKKLDVTSSNPDFTTKVEQKSANEFRISVKPQETTKAGAATLTIKPALGGGKSKTLYATASVAAAPTSTTTQPASAAGSPAQAGKTTIAINKSSQGKIDACSLLTSKEIESIQGEPLQDSKSSGSTAGAMSFSQCYFALPTSSNSISLTVMQKLDGPNARDPKEYWKETFHADKDKEKGHAEEGEKGAAPEKIEKLGDEAFWMGNRVGGELYVLKGNSFIRISVGGAGDKAAKIDKSSKLAEAILKRI